MRDAGAVWIALAIVVFVLSHVANWWIFRRRADSRIRTLDAHRRRLTALLDGLLQDLQGLALSLQALAEPMAEANPTRARIEQILDHIDGLLSRARRHAQGQSDD